MVFSRSARPLIVGAGSPSIAGSYIVGLRGDRAASRSVRTQAETLSATYHGRLGRVWDSVLAGFAVRMNEVDANSITYSPWTQFDGRLRP